MNNKDVIFYKDKPVFGLDIGYSSMKTMQIDHRDKKGKIVGYGTTRYDSSATKNGVIVDLATVAKAAYELFNDRLVGDITTSRVIFSVPASHCYSRSVRLPKLQNKDLKEAINLEVEQYVPVAYDKLYVDFTKITETNDEAEYLVIAVPKAIVDSYMQLSQILNLEVAGIQTSITAGGRLFRITDNSDVPTVLIDLGSLSSDLTIFDNDLVITSTVSSGSDNFTSIIASTLGVTQKEAHIIKTKYGLSVSKKQRQITDGLNPTLQQMVREIKRMIRYYEERADKNSKISQIITMGGGANMPGLSDYLINSLRQPVRLCEPWPKLDFGKLQPPNNIEKSMYITAAGLALTNPKELF